jgi:zinc-ribbon domain
MTKKTYSPPAKCPVCGADVPPRAKTCPACGADERSGWNEEAARYAQLDLPDDSFNYDETLKDEGLKARVKPKGISVFWWLAAMGVLALVIYLVSRGGL